MTADSAPAVDPAQLEAALTFNPYDPAFRADPHPVYQRNHAIAPVIKTEAGIWIVYGHREINAVLRDPRFGWGDAPLSASHFTTAEDGTVVRPLTFTDPPDHTRLRPLVSKAFSARRMERLRSRADELAAELLGEAKAKAQPFDFLRAVSYPLPGILLGELVGVDADRHEQFRDWSEAMGRGLDPDFLLPPEVLAKREEAREGFHDYFREVAARRRVEPADDLVSALVAVQDEGLLSETELVVMCTILFSAGYATTVHMIGNGLLALLRNPDQFAWLRQNPDRMAGAVEELLRYDGTVQMVSRVPLEDADIDGRPIRAGEPILMMIASANRDPAVFENPNTLDLSRPQGHNLGFGLGIHFCLGAPLARLAAQAVLSAVCELDIELADPEPQWNDGLVMRGMTELLVTIK